MKELDFQKNKVEVMTLEELSQTYRENYPNGLPVGGMYHFALIQQILESFERYNLKYEVKEVFAANNNDRYRPGVTIANDVALEKGDKSLEAHILRRVYANIEQTGSDDPEWHFNCAVAYHQKGIQVAFGPMVYVCHNQTIMSAEDIFSTQKISQCKGEERLERDVTAMLSGVNDYVERFGERMQVMAKTVKDWKQRPFLPEDFRHVLADLMLSRVAHDSKDPHIHQAEDYPLTSSQINAACERYLQLEYEKGRMATCDPTYWEAFNTFNTDLKPGRAEIPSIVGQSIGLFKSFEKCYINSVFKDE